MPWLMNTRELRSLVNALALSALIIGCGDDGDDDDDDGGGVPASPVAACEKLASTYCGRQFECLRDTGMYSDSALRDTRSSCESEFELAAMCPRASTIKPSYEQCIDLVSKGPCDPITTTGYVPAACEDVILTDD